MSISRADLALNFLRTPDVVGSILTATSRFRWNRLGPMFATEIRKSRAQLLRACSNWQWHLDEVFVKVNGETHYLRQAVDHEGEVPESFATKRRDRKAAMKFPRKE